GVHLNLTPSGDCSEYSPDVAGKITGSVSEDGVSVASQRERTLRVTRDCKIWMIEQIVGFRSKCNLRALSQMEALLECQIKLREGGTAQNITARSTELTRRW